VSLALTPGWAVGLLLLIAVLVLVFVVLVDGGPRIGRGGLGTGGGYALALVAILAPVPAPALTLFGAGLKSRCADVRGWASTSGTSRNLTDGVQRVRVSLPCGFVPGAPGGTPRASMLSYRG
jgi:type IV secretory pathway TrbL component